MRAKTALLMILIVIILTVCFYYTKSLNDKILEQSESIVSYEQMITEMSVKLTTTENTVDALIKEVNTHNDLIDKESVKYKALLTKYNTWVNKPPEVKYINKVVKQLVTETKYIETDCSDINKMIEGIEYDDL